MELRMDPILSHILTFALGLLSAAVLLWIQDKRQVQRTISREVYKPLHGELFAIYPLIEKGQRTGRDGSLWKGIQAAGHANSISSGLFDKLDRIYGTILPAYDAAWLAAQAHVDTLGQLWDAQHGRPPGPAVMKDVDWWSLLTNSEFVRPPIALLAGDALRIRNNGVHLHTLQANQTSVDQFLRDRWDEAHNDAEFESFRNCRAAALNDSRQLRASLLKRIRP